jgi:hypothetical protein
MSGKFTRIAAQFAAARSPLMTFAATQRVSRLSARARARELGLRQTAGAIASAADMISLLAHSARNK